MSRTHRTIAGTLLTVIGSYSNSALRAAAARAYRAGHCAVLADIRAELRRRRNRAEDQARSIAVAA